ncbi:META domain-containing protein [cf. Phormidesmis sp. LEGE 11477]|uniref:META domain-containing protein n=1 Tax=cf. Phormidesmis sp. LEGE 11477 TaxID=1828680 RepID=UPI0018814B04|nr:META domain-containing protein [cf. Phormidesmis sp. LEGE 11477]MBE9062081.1 META domain-containing protein [cf. Phormidesmis sp. LEGE 11477]
MTQHRRLDQRLNAVFVGTVAFFLVLTGNTVAIANGVISSEIENLRQGWRLTHYNQQPVESNIEFTIEFDLGGEIHGFDSCNYYDGRYLQRAGEQMVVSVLGRTLMRCTSVSETMSDYQYGQLLSQVNRYILSNSSLRLETPDGSELVYEVQLDDDMNDEEVSSYQH